MQATVMLGCFRKVDAHDPEIFVAAIEATLARFAPEVIDHVCGPDGIAARQTFTPSVAEVRAACEHHERAMARRQERETRERRQLDDRRQFKLERQNAPGRAEIEAKLDANRRTKPLDGAQNIPFDIRQNESATPVVSGSGAEGIHPEEG